MAASQNTEIIKQMIQTDKEMSVHIATLIQMMNLISEDTDITVKHLKQSDGLPRDLDDLKQSIITANTALVERIAEANAKALDKSIKDIKITILGLAGIVTIIASLAMWIVSYIDKGSIGDAVAKEFEKQKQKIEATK